MVLATGMEFHGPRVNIRYQNSNIDRTPRPYATARVGMFLPPGSYTQDMFIAAVKTRIPFQPFMMAMPVVRLPAFRVRTEMLILHMPAIRLKPFLAMTA